MMAGCSYRLAVYTTQICKTGYRFAFHCDQRKLFFTSGKRWLLQENS